MPADDTVLPDDTAVLGDAWLGHDPLPADPMPAVERWLADAWADGRQRNPHAFALATADASGRPSARMVLCNELDAERGAIVFYSHRPSRKGVELAARPWASAVFHWQEAGRQVRLDGPVELLDDAASDHYFRARPLDAQVGAWASQQSAPIASRAELEARLLEEARRLGVPWPALEASDPSAIPSVPRPAHWGGFRLIAEEVELWVSRPARIHDRAVWSRRLERAEGEWRSGPWLAARLQP